MKKSEIWMHIFFVIICIFDVVHGLTIWATFWCCGIWVNAWMYERGMYAKFCGYMEAKNGKAKG